MFIVVGTTHLDISLSGIPHLPPKGRDEFSVDSLVFSETPLRMVLGGSGGTAAYALARLGVQVLLCSAIGRDIFGEMIGNWLAEPGVRLAGLLRTSTAATSTMTVLSDNDRNRLFVHHRGATGQFDGVKISPGAFREGGVLLINAYSLIDAWRPERAQAALAEARHAKVITALDIGPAVGAPVTLDEVASLLHDVNYFFCNEQELAACTGTDDMAEGALRVLRGGAKCVVLKQGRRGVTVFPGKEEAPIAVPGFEVDAIWATGAGDAFSAGFLYGVQREWSLERAARFANAVAALVVRSGRGALGAPTLADVERVLAKGIKSKEG